MELIQAMDACSSLNASVQEIITSNNISLDSPWYDYEVLNAALKQGNKVVANQLLDISCTVNKDIESMELLDTPLHNAVKLGELQLVEKLLKKSAFVTAVNADANTPLHLSFLLKNYEIVDLMLLHIEENSSYNDMTNKDGLTHLHIACARGNAQVAYSYEYVGADISCVVSETSQEYPGYSCLQFACDSKSPVTIQVVLRAIKFLGDCSGKKKKWFRDMSLFRSWGRIIIETHHEGYSFGEEKKKLLSKFHSACFNGCIDKVAEFIKKGEDVNSTMIKDALACPLSTPLHFAVEADKNRQKVVELLLANSADINLKNGLCMTPLHCALYSDPYRQAKDSYVSDAEQDHALKVIYEAVKDKESNHMDPFGLTYFHAAVALNDLDAVKKFIEAGQANCKPILPNSRNFSMWSPLHFAVKYGNEDVAELLIQRGANVNANEDQNHFDTPLQVAIKYSQSRMVNLLLAHGANAKVVAYDGGKTTLHILVERFGEYKDEKPELLRLVDTLIRCGVDVNAPDSGKFTPLHDACLRIDKAPEIVDELLKQGADINVLDNDDDVPFDRINRRIFKTTPKVFLELHHHVQKLKQLGLEVHSKNEDFCERIMKKKEDWQKSEEWCSEEELSRRKQEWIQEIEKLKNDMLNEKVSMYDYLKMEGKQAADLAQNEKIEKLVANEQLRSVYSAYGYLISVVHRKSLRRFESHEPTQEAKIQEEQVNRVGELVPPIYRQKKIAGPTKESDQQLPANITLLDAIKLGKAKWVEELLEKGVSTKPVDEKKNGPLHLAFELNHEEIVDLLLSHIEENSDYANSPNVQGLTQLHIAAARGNTSVVQDLLDAGAKPSDLVNKNSPTYPGYTALLFACDGKHLDTAKVLTKAMKVYGNIADDVEASFASLPHQLKELDFGCFLMSLFGDKEHLSEFHQACISSETTAADISRFLLRRIDVNKPTTRNSKNYPVYTALHFAVESTSDRQEKVELLLEHGADVNRRSALGTTPLHLACYKDTKKEREEDDTLRILYDAAKEKQVNLMDAFGLTYFHIAVARDDRLLVKKMVFYGEDVNRVVLPNLRGLSKYTPLHFAARYGRAEMAKVLIERGAKVRDDDAYPRYETPLQTAIIRGKCDVIKVLLEHGASSKVVQPDSKKTTIHLLADRFEATSIRTSEGQDEKGELTWIVEKLAKGGANVDAKDSEGFTALQSCCANLMECSDMVRWLLWMGADVNVKARGKTALDYANGSRFKENYESFFELYEHVQKLKELGLKVDPKNEKFCAELLEDRKKWDKLDEDERWAWDFVKKDYTDEALAKEKVKRQKEIRRLKKDMLADGVSMYDYIRMDGKKAAQFLGNERLRKVDGIAEGQTLYDEFGYLIPVVYRKSQRWIEDQESSEKAIPVKQPVAKAQVAKHKRS